MRRVAAFAFLWLLVAGAAHAEGRTVVGVIVRIDPPARTLSVKDGLGTVWNYKVDRGAGIDLRAFKAGATVAVTIGRATPLNMSSPADRIRKGDRVVPIPPGKARRPVMMPPMPK